MATDRTFGNMINERSISKKPLSEDDMSQLPDGGLKLPRYMESSYSKMLAATDPSQQVSGASKKEKM